MRAFLAHPLVRFAPLLEGLSKAGFAHYVDAMLSKAAAPERDVAGIADHLAYLYSVGHTDAADRLLGEALQGRSPGARMTLVDALHQLNQTAALSAAAAWFRSRYATVTNSKIDEILRGLGLDKYDRQS